MNYVNLIFYQVTCRIIIKATYNGILIHVYTLTTRSYCFVGRIIFHMPVPMSAGYRTNYRAVPSYLFAVLYCQKKLVVFELS